MNDENEAFTAEKDKVMFENKSNANDTYDEVEVSKFMMSIYKRMDIFVKNNQTEQEAMLAKMRDMMKEIQKNGMRQEIHLKEAIERIEIDSNSAASRMEAVFAAQKKVPGKRLRQMLAMVTISSIVSGLIGGLTVHYFIPEMNADMRHQLVAGKMLQASWGTLSKADQDKIVAVGLGVEEAKLKEQGLKNK